MKLLRTIRLEAPDSFVFDKAAGPGEWAVSCAFVIEQVRGDAVYLSTTTDEVLRLKPQNLVAGLPIRQVEAVN